MRKKSHISLAICMVESLNNEELRRHKLAFCLGSILPDIKPSFLYKRHEINQTFPALKKHIERLSEGDKAIEKKTRKYYMDLGQISHYLADYFTFPHNESYPGTLAEHCYYEEQLKQDLRACIKSGEAAKLLADESEMREFDDAKALCDFIQKIHASYISNVPDVQDDIYHIILVNYLALSGMMELLASRSQALYRVASC